MIDNKVIVIVGPTASGKSGLAIELAKEIDGVIISADSMQIYKDLDVGTAKVTPREAQGIKHELIDICGVSENFDVARYKDLCYNKIHEIKNLGKTPIIVGGTGLYINAVVNNMQFGNINESEEKENKLKELDKKSNEELYTYLQSIDDDSAKLVDSSNKRRIIQAIKLHMYGTSKANNHNTSKLWEDNGSEYDFLVFYIDIPRDLLYDKINVRVDEMLDKGILNEAKLVFDLQNTGNKTILQAIGYKEFFEYFSGQKTLSECIELLKLNTRHYAKRQITWFKKLKNKYILDGTKKQSELVKEIKGYYEN